MTFSFSNFTSNLQAGQPISSDEVLAARRWARSDGGISPAEAETIVEMNRLNSAPSPEWADFFVEALAEFVVNRLQPRGYVDEGNAAWLMAQIDQDGRLETYTELELLVKVLETALNAPPALKDYALRQIEQSVITGEGPTRRGGPISPGVVDEAEVLLLRRILFASGGEGALTVSRHEADLLWRIKDATLGAANAPGWKTLFVQGVGNHLMAYSSYKPLERNEAQRLETFMNDHRVSVGGFLGRMVSSLSGRHSRPQAPEEAAQHRQEAIAASLAITPAEAAWLKQHHESDGVLDPLEQALLEFVADESRQ
jgi:hypothetical protein